MSYFKYGNEALNHLCTCDDRMAKAINKIGFIKRETTPNLFVALIKSIVSQQISTKAAETVWGRLLKTLGKINPKNLALSNIEKIQSCGLSFRKTSYMKEIAAKILNNQFDLSKLTNLSDEEVIIQLSSLKGIGKWTAEMIMIFSMERLNIISWDDLAIRRGLMILYNLDNLSKEEFNMYQLRYSPYASVASLYLWAIAGGVVID